MNRLVEKTISENNPYQSAHAGRSPRTNLEAPDVLPPEIAAMPRPPLRFGSFLAPGMFSVYGFLAEHVVRRLAWPTEIHVGRSYEQASDDYDICFICGLAYIELARGESPSMEPIVAPVLQGERFGGRPIYFSDVIVRRDSSLRLFRRSARPILVLQRTLLAVGLRHHLLLACAAGANAGLFRPGGRGRMARALD